jgi:hypothetical protein
MAEGKVNPIQLQKYLKGVGYPASKKDLVERAKRQGAGEDLVRALNAVSRERFATPAEVSKAVSGGGGSRSRR